MKRSLALALSAALLLVSAPPAAWASAAAAARASGAARGVPALPPVRLQAPATFAPSTLRSLTPSAAPLAAPSAVAPSVAAAVSPLSPAGVSAAAVEIAAEAAALSNLSDGGSREAGERVHARLAGGAAPVRPASEVLASPARSQGTVLAPASQNGPARRFGPAAPRPGRAVRALSAVARIGGAAAGVVALQTAAAALLPAVFGLAPVAAIWALIPGLLFVPMGAYARYRLAKRDSPRLAPAKRLLDIALGAVLGAAWVAAPHAAAFSAVGAAAVAAPALAMAGGRAAGTFSFADSMLTWAALGLVPVALGAVAVTGAIGVAPLLGMLALPAMTTAAFFLGRLIRAAETGEPFSVPGSGLQKVRFPAFQWVMLGVVFALLTGYSAVHTNIAFVAWQLLGMRDTGKSFLTFDKLYLGLLVFTAFTGFASPLTFLVLAFAPERMAAWTERALARWYKKGPAAPSTRLAPPAELQSGQARWPEFHYRLKTAALIGTMFLAGGLLASTVFGFGALLTNGLIASAIAFVPFFFAKRIIKAVMKGKPATRKAHPELYEIVEELRDKINARRRAEAPTLSWWKRVVRGKAEIPTPELIMVAMPVPNAFATGRSPQQALVGVTEIFERMVLDPEEARAGLVRLISASDPSSKEYRVFRRGIAASLTGIRPDAAPSELAAAVLQADRRELYALGRRMYRGVLAHELSHVMDRHMLTGSIAGAVSSAVHFASYGVMWGVGHAQAALKAAAGRVVGRREPPSEGQRGSGARPEAFEPVSVGLALKSLPLMAKLFAALFSPVALQINQMAVSRNNEGMADEDGALLSGDPESLALALGLLSSWRPPQGAGAMGFTLPRAAALQHLMIVNPFEQLDAAAPRGAGPTQADNFFFELFITHPDTGTRIKKLHDMGEALRSIRPRRPRPPDEGGGGGGSSSGPLAFAAPDDGGGLLSGARRALSSLGRVLPDEGRNRMYWTLTLGQALASLGAGFHFAAFPGLAAPAAADAPRLGYGRAASWSAQAAASAVAGPLADRAEPGRVAALATLARAGLMLLVPVLFFTTGLSFPVFIALLAAASFIELVGMTAAAVAYNRVVGPYPERYNRAGAIGTVLGNAAGVAGPLLAGTLIGSAWAGRAAGAGNAAAYLVFAAALGASGAVWLARLRAPAAGGAAPRGAGGIGAGLKLLARDRFLRLYMLSSALPLMTSAALMSVALPLMLATVGAGGGSFGLLLAASALGSSIGSALMAFSRGAVEKQARLTSYARAGAWLFNALVLTQSAPWVAAGLLLVSAILASPSSIAWSSVVTKRVVAAHAADQGKVYAALSFGMLLFSIAGALASAALAGALAPGAALAVVTAALAACALLDVLLPRFILPQAGPR